MKFDTWAIVAFTIFMITSWYAINNLIDRVEKLESVQTKECE